MTNPFVKAQKSQSKLRLAIDGPSGSGKTYTALIAATVMAAGGKIALIDTERGSASLYADKFEFDTATLANFNPKNYVDLIHAAEEAGFSVIVIDSLSHAWEGEGGALDMVDAAAARSQSKNSYFAWRDVTPLHRDLVDAMLQSKCHIIATMRSKTEYVIDEVDRNGKKSQVPRKIGLAPIQRQGMEYEFTIVGDMDLEHTLVISKSRCDFIADAVVKKPDPKFFSQILTWLNSGSAEPARPAAAFQSPEPDPAAAPAAAAPKPNGKPIEQPGMTLEQAAAVKTPNGTPLGTCTDEQLKVVIGNTGPKTTSSIKAAATLLLAKPDAEAWSAWYALASQGAELGLADIPQPADAISACALRRMLNEWAPKVNAAVENQIPADFR